MPYGAFRQMSDDDTRAVVAYLRTLKPIRHEVPKGRIDFPVNLFIKFAPQPIEGPVDAPDDQRDHAAYGRYLVELAGCRECHTPHDDRGHKLAGQEFSGGWAMKGPWGTVVTPNVTPAKGTYLAAASRENFVGRFKSYAAINAETAPVVPPAQRTVMPWTAFAGMTEADLGAIYDYLRTVTPIPTRSGAIAQGTAAGSVTK